MKQQEMNFTMKILFYIYIICLFLFVIIKINNGLRDMDIFNIFNPNLYLKVNLTPFETINGYTYALSYGLSMNIFLNVAGNTIVFIPLGFFIGYLYEKTFIRTILICFLISLFFEFFQLLTNLGSFDIDDIILNVSSCVVGYFIYYIFYLIVLKPTITSTPLSHHL